MKIKYEFRFIDCETGDISPIYRFVRLTDGYARLEDLRRDYPQLRIFSINKKYLYKR